MMLLPNPRMQNQAWREAMLRPLPGRWKKNLAKRIEELDVQHQNWRSANEFLIERVTALCNTKLPLDANDNDIRHCAARRADEATGIASRLKETGLIVNELRVLCQRWRIAEPQNVGPGGYIARLCDPLWWAKRLRKMHGETLETEAVKLGIVHKRHDCYVSQENLYRREAQNARNAAMLERTYAANEDGECFSLAELAERSISNKAIRRGELMLRMRGMQDVAWELGHPAEFAVVTAPSRFHAVRGDGRLNPKYEFGTPKDTMAWFNRQWRRCQSWLARRGVEYYGIRTVEAHHDGTPHWNILVFLNDQRYVETWRSGLYKYFLLADCPDEKGARKRRIKFKAITKEMGGAASYIAKYISKNIDGYGLDKDLLGNEIVTATKRVEAWAKTWGIHQFEPIGGPSVGIWRELRRIPATSIENAPPEFRRAWEAAQRVESDIEGQDKKADYAEFIRALGGPFVKRHLACMRVHKEECQGQGRYGEPLGMRPAGISVRGEWVIDKGGIVGTIATTIEGIVFSVRRAWTILQSKAADFSASRTRVNNCTRGAADDFPKYEKYSPQEPKRQRFDPGIFQWTRGYDDFAVA